MQELKRANQISLLIHERPFSINSMYFNRPDNKKIRSLDARNWSRLIFIQLNNQYNLNQLKLFRDAFDPKTMGIGIHMTTHYKRDTFFTKKDQISSRTMDISNIEKPIIDLIFDPKYFKRKCPEGCQNLNLNDKYIVGMISNKLPSKTGEMYMFIKLWTVKLEDLNEK